MRGVGFPCAPDQPEEVYSSPQSTRCCHGIRVLRFFLWFCLCCLVFLKINIKRENLWQYHSISNVVKSNIYLQLPICISYWVIPCQINTVTRHDHHRFELFLVRLLDAMKKNSHKMLGFWVDPDPKYGSLNFDQNALTDTGQSVISQLLWDLDR